MIKRKFGDSVRAKTDVAMRNEALAKILCHNIACCITRVVRTEHRPDELDAEGRAAAAPADDGPRGRAAVPGRLSASLVPQPLSSVELSHRDGGPHEPAGLPLAAVELPAGERKATPGMEFHQ